MISLSPAHPAAIPPVVVARQGGQAGVAALRRRLEDVALRHGFNGAAYMHLGHGLDAQEAGPRRLVAVGGLDEAVYRRCGYLAIDPVARRAAKAFLPFVWSMAEVSEDDAAPLARSMRTWGITAGVAAPVQDYATGPAFLNLFKAGADSLDIDQGALMIDASRLHADLRGEAGQTDHAPPIADLGDRELEVLRLAALGRTEADTAVALGLSRRGVQFHLARVMAKLDAPNKTAAVALAVNAGLIRL
jgi:DNA-binding CsgD family transcriptional regulator